MKHYAALLGDPVAHSSSPGIMAQLAAISGEDFDYRLIQTPTAKLPQTLIELEEDSLCIGLNVTLPHKVDVLTHVRHAAPSAQRIGATNCLVRCEEGTWVAHNTDLDGCRSMLEGLDLNLEGKEVWLLGAGGAALAAIAAIQDLGVKTVYLWNRSEWRALEVQKSFETGVEVVGDLLPGSAPSLILNATSLGLQAGDLERFEAQFGESFRSTGVSLENVPCVDLVYAKGTQAETEFLRWMSSHGAHSRADGKQMLIAQAIEAFNLWFQSPLYVPETIRKISL